MKAAPANIDKLLQRRLGREFKLYFNETEGCWQIWRVVLERQAVSERLGELEYRREAIEYPGPLIFELDSMLALGEGGVDLICSKYEYVSGLSEAQRAVSIMREKRHALAEKRRRDRLQEGKEAQAELWGWLMKKADNWTHTADTKETIKEVDKSLEEQERWIKTGIPGTKDSNIGALN